MSHKIKDPGRVHFTHHLCIANREGPLHGRNDGSRGDIVWRGSEIDDPWRQEFNTDGRHVDYWCHHATRKGEGSPKFTTNAGEVTCKVCRANNADNTARAWKKKLAETHEMNRHYYANWHSDEELTLQCWWMCCRHRVDVSPFETPAEERRFVLDRRAKKLLRAAGSTMAFLGVGPADEEFKSIVPKLQERIAKLDPADQPHMARYLVEAQRVDKLLAEAHKGFEKLHELSYAAALLVQYGKRGKQPERARPGAA